MRKIITNRCLWLFIVFLSAFIVYSNTFHNEFVFDDMGCVVNNSLIKDWRNLPRFFSRDYFALASEISYRPGVTLSYFVDYSLHKLNVPGWHFTNIFLHGLNGVLVVLILLRLSGQPVIAVLSGLLFVIHPIQTEAVNAIGFREDTLSFFFMAGAFYLFLARGNSLRRYLLSCVCFLLAVFTKEMAVVLPVVVLWYVICCERKKLREYLPAMAGYFCLALLFSAGRMLWNAKAPLAYPGGNIFTALMSFGKAILYYLRLLFLPVDLCLDYDKLIETSHFDTGVAAAVIVMAALAFLTFRMLRSSHPRPLIAFGIGTFFIMLLPVSNIIPFGHVMAERYLYNSSAAFFGIAAAGIYAVYRLPRFRYPVLAAAAALMVVFGTMTLRQNLWWKNEFTLWSHLVAQRPDSMVAQYNLGVAYWHRNEYRNAITALERSITIDPQHSEAYGNLIEAYAETGEYAKAVDVFRKAVQLTPSSARLYRNIGKVCVKAADHPAAIAAFSKQVEFAAADPEAYFNLGLAHKSAGNLAAALDSFQKAVSLDPSYAEAFNTMGNTLLAMGQLPQAALAFQKAIALDPSSAEAYNNLGTYYSKINDLEQAVQMYEKAIACSTTAVTACLNLGITYQRMGRHTLAAGALEKYVTLVPDDPEAASMRSYIRQWKKGRESQDGHQSGHQGRDMNTVPTNNTAL
jgi:tetratricopeptide (TPR) repeat protein